MAIGNGILGNISGKVGNIVFASVKGEQVARAYQPLVQNPQTTLQMTQRVKWLNIIAAWRVLSPYLKKAFESKKRNVSDYNAFMSYNLQAADPRYLTKQQFNSGYRIISNFVLSRGSLETIQIDSTSGAIGINLPGLDWDTDTVAEFSRIVVANNPNFRYGDQISLIICPQNIITADEASGGQTIGANFYATVVEVTLSALDNTLISNIFDSRLFTFNDDGYFIFNTSLGRAQAVAVIQSRRTQNKLLVSSQNMVVMNSDALVELSNLDESIISYGVSGEYFLEPEINISTGSGDDGSGDDGNYPV